MSGSCPPKSTYDEEKKECVCQSPLYNKNGKCTSCGINEHLNIAGTGCEPKCPSSLKFVEMETHAQVFEALGYISSICGIVYFSWQAYEFLTTNSEAKTKFINQSLRGRKYVEGYGNYLTKRFTREPREGVEAWGEENPIRRNTSSNPSSPIAQLNQAFGPR